MFSTIVFELRCRADKETALQTFLENGMPLMINHYPFYTVIEVERSSWFSTQVQEEGQTLTQRINELILQTNSNQ